MNFFKRIGASIYGPEFYRELLTRPFSFSLGYFYMLILSAAFVIALTLGFRVAPQLNAFLNELSADILKSYPDGLTVTVKNGEASTNAEEPYVIPLPEGESGVFHGEPGIKNLIVLDTRNPFSIETFEEYKTVAVLSKNSIALRDKDGEIRIQPLANVPHFELTKARVERFVGVVRPWLRVLTPLVFLLIGIGVFIFLNLKLIYFLVAALFVLVIAKVKKLQITYGKAYQVAIHAATPGILAQVLSMIGFFPRIPYLTTILLIVIVSINLRSPKNIAIIPAELPTLPGTPR